MNDAAVGFAGSFGIGGVARATPSVVASVCDNPPSVARSSAPFTSATIMNGPLKPAPNPSASRS